MNKTQRKIKWRSPELLSPVKTQRRADVVVVPVNRKSRRDWSPKLMNTRTTSPGRESKSKYPERLQPVSKSITQVAAQSPLNTRRPIVTVPKEKMANRCCFTALKKTDFGQTTERGVDIEMMTYLEVPKEVMCQSILPQPLYDTQGVDTSGLMLPTVSQTLHEIYMHKETTPVLIKDISAHSHEEPPISRDSIQWNNIDKVEDIEMMLDNLSKELMEPIEQYTTPKRVAISDRPRIKKIADRFSKYKTTNNIELRRLEEKVVCVEYEVFDKSTDANTPVQVMRAFFSIKPPNKNVNEAVKQVPSDIKAKLNVNPENINTFTEQEIEIIDAKIAENMPYLDDLRGILKRKKNRNNNKDSPTLDLKSLYEIAKRQRWIGNDYSDSNVLTKEELTEMKDLILQQCTSSVHGVSRKKIKKGTEVSETISDSLVEVMFKDSLIQS